MEGAEIKVNRKLIIKKNSDLRDPSLAGLDGKQCEHGNKAVVVVKVLPVPLPRPHYRRQI